MSRHPWLKRQEEELERFFGSIILEQIATPFTSAQKIIEVYKKGNYDEMVIAAPLSVIAKIIELSINPLWAEMKLVSKEEAEVEVKGRYYRLERFRRIEKIEIKFGEL